MSGLIRSGLIRSGLIRKELICRSEMRRERVRRQQQLNGLDYLEVGELSGDEPSLAGQRLLRVYFLGKAPVALTPANVKIEGGSRIRDINVVSVDVHTYRSVELDDYMLVSVDRAGDFSSYTLRVVERREDGQWQPHSAFDPRYDRLVFSFKADCPGDLDCLPAPPCPVEPVGEPDINYLAKDYGSFRQLILDRLALVMPQWRERHVPDIGIALAEVLAYAGDHLSYYQDAVATEAYLGTARKRISVRRHARLVDYPMHEGCNARTWVCVQTDTDLEQLDPGDMYFITGGALQGLGKVITEQDIASISPADYEVFEPMVDGSISIYRNHNKIRFYDWGDKECCLPKGAVRATLAGELAAGTAPAQPPCEADGEPDERQDADRPYPQDREQSPPDGLAAPAAEDPAVAPAPNPPPRLYLKPGDVLMFEEIVGPTTGMPGDADPKHRHAVRLSAVEAGIDPLNGCPVVHIEWGEADRLPFALCISSLGPPPDCEMINPVSIACGNVILVDHGRSRAEGLGSVPVDDTRACCKGEGVVGDTRLTAARYRPYLSRAPLTFSQPLAPALPAAQALDQDVRQALPQVALTSYLEQDVVFHWSVRRDLFASGPEDHHFVAEIDEDGRAHLRFGDDEAGEKPDAGMKFDSSYRVGNGVAGNVGAEAISHLVFRSLLSGVTLNARNPLPARGGTEAETLAEVKLFAPHTFRRDLQRAITAEDYAAIVAREFKHQVQRAAARLRWNGSWYEVLVAVDPYGSDEAGPELIAAVAAKLHRYRRIGHDLVVKSARKVPLDIEIRVCVLPNYLRGHVKAALLDLLSNRRLADGKLGFFHPDNLTFGEDIHLSRLVAVAQAVAGVQSVQVTKLQRQHQPPNQEIENGVLPLGPFEVARLDSDPSQPENGRLTLTVGGGR
ncbi:putative baseplate assembly protein [Exilibacterium tricleocarpae]|uniref:Putative baseplate assembly protein n=1 Tax=Exilibacterium tricleocarpae TaxID=2591008 RepID=A0A545TZ34_9GAMM|nr:putative baseplate assembly protein [Exilibacterium tricleocarpae]TQV82476.1 putative baseplate assembly protein [Exilibacterium tricleocarpae]